MFDAINYNHSYQMMYQPDKMGASVRNRHQLTPTHVTEPSSLDQSKATSAKKAPSIEGCKTCRERVYVDGSSDPGVSFKHGGTISPGSSAAMVSSHEQEHVTRERDRAENQGREVVSQSVRLSGGICPECGKNYISGGETRTIVKGRNSPEPSVGQNLDVYA